MDSDSDSLLGLRYRWRFGGRKGGGDRVQRMNSEADFIGTARSSYPDKYLAASRSDTDPLTTHDHPYLCEENSGRGSVDQGLTTAANRQHSIESILGAERHHHHHHHHQLNKMNSGNFN